MGQYRQRKMEYFKGSSTAMRLYKGWLTLFALFAVVTLTWKITTSGYTEPVYFLLDFLVCGFSLIALLSFVGFDQYTVLGNVTFLLVFLSGKVYRTLHYLGAFGGGQAAPVPDLSAGMGAMDMGGMMSAGGGMGMGGMGMGEMAEMAAAPVSPDIGLLGQLVQKALNGPLKTQGDFSKFIVVMECELFGVLCIFFIVFFISHWKFFRTPLAQLREKE